MGALPLEILFEKLALSGKVLALNKVQNFGDSVVRNFSFHIKPQSILFILAPGLWLLIVVSMQRNRVKPYMHSSFYRMYFILRHFHFPTSPTLWCGNVKLDCILFGGNGKNKDWQTWSCVWWLISTSTTSYYGLGLGRSCIIFILTFFTSNKCLKQYSQ